MDVDYLINLLESSERIYADNRFITKFNAKGIPYLKRIESIGGIRTLTTALRQRMKRDKNPIIIVGDMSGMSTFNNEYGRETADLAIEKCLRLFSKEMKKIGLPISPSGDEMWLLPDSDIKVSHMISTIKDFLIKLNNVGLEINGKKVGLNAKFYIGRKPFSEVEGVLKVDESGNKLPPGTIKVDKELTLNKDSDKVINYPEVSDDSVIELSEADFRDLLWNIKFKDVIKDMDKRSLILRKEDIEDFIKQEKARGKSTSHLEAYLQEILRELKKYVR